MVLLHFQQYFSYTSVAVSFIGGGNRSEKTTGLSHVTDKLDHKNIEALSVDVITQHEM
jgi:hypothetical protein